MRGLYSLSSSSRVKPENNDELPIIETPHCPSVPEYKPPYRIGKNFPSHE
jgi:hypothetical protein